MQGAGVRGAGRNIRTQMRKKQRNWILLIIAIPAVTLAIFLRPSLFNLQLSLAEISKNDKFQLEAGGFAGGTTETEGNKFQVPTATISDISATEPRTIGNSISVTPGLVSVITKGTEEVIVNPFDIEAVFAKTDPMGATLTPATWQQDNDPYFYWTVYGTHEGIVGYSFALDIAPDETIDIQVDSYPYASDSMADGHHTFHVMAQNTAGNWGKEGSFEIWVDASGPQVVSFSPGNKALLNTDRPTLAINIKDDNSGVDSSSIVLKVNGTTVTHQYDPSQNQVSYIPSIPLSDGLNTLRFDVKDWVGNVMTTLVWSFTVDTTPPTGQIVINHDDPQSNSIQVRLDLSAEDITTSVKEMMISNRADFGGGQWESYSIFKYPWSLDPISGIRTIYVKFKDEAGNESLAYSDSIELTILAPDTLITSGPGGVIEQTGAVFAYMALETNCQFQYKIDTGPWSSWTTQTTITLTDVKEGNHYFQVKAGKDVDGNGQIDLDEEDPTPASRTWTVSVTKGTAILEPEQPIKFWYME